MTAAIKIVVGAVLTSVPMLLLAYAAGGWPAIAASLILVIGFGSFFGGLVLLADSFP